TTLCRVSSDFGIASITSAPTSGRNTTAVAPQPLSRSFTVSTPSSSNSDHEDGGQDGRTQEQVCAVGLALAGLGLARALATTVRGGSGGVDRAVDRALVDVAVDELTAATGGAADQVHHPVDDVVVDPVGRAGDRALGGAGDPVDVEDVEPVLALEH